MAEEEKRVSRFSSGINILNRLDQLWRNCAIFKRRGEYLKWSEELDSVWLELARDLPEKSDDGLNFVTQEREFKKFDEQLTQDGQIKDGLTNSFDGIKKDDKIKRAKQYATIMKKQLFLARLENKIGKGTTYEDTEDDEF